MALIQLSVDKISKFRQQRSAHKMRCIIASYQGLRLISALRYKFKFKSLRVVKFLEFHQKQTHKLAKFKAAKI